MTNSPEYSREWARRNYRITRGLAPDATLIRKSQRGESSHVAKLTWGKVDEAREMHKAGHKTQFLADRFGVAYMTMRNVLMGKSWRKLRREFVCK